MRKALRSSLPARFDLVQWLKDRRYADTTGQAEKIILAGRVKSESHTLGIGHTKRLKPLTKLEKITSTSSHTLENVDVVERYIDVALKPNVHVLAERAPDLTENAA